MDSDLERVVRSRAAGRCEYCLIPEDCYPAAFQIDHVIARQHRGPTTAANLALSCLHCNSHKGPNIASRDRVTRRLTPLFNPRRHKWARHFRWDGPELLGRTAVGRVTIDVLDMNGPFLVELREALMDEGRFSPE